DLPAGQVLGHLERDLGGAVLVGGEVGGPVGGVGEVLADGRLLAGRRLAGLALPLLLLAGLLALVLLAVLLGGVVAVLGSAALASAGAGRARGPAAAETVARLLIRVAAGAALLLVAQLLDDGLAKDAEVRHADLVAAQQVAEVVRHARLG